MYTIDSSFNQLDKSPKRAFICGVSGQDGAYLAKYLLTNGYKVFGSSRNIEANQFQNLLKLDLISKVQLISMPPSDAGGVLEVLKLIKPDQIYNLSGQSSVGLSFEKPQETFDSIVNPTKNILEAIRVLKLNTRFFSAGSGECFGGSTDRLPSDEKSPFNPLSPYAVAKVQAHQLVQKYREEFGLFACTGILFNHESSLRSTKFVTQKIVQAVLNISNALRSGRVPEKLHLGNLSIRRDWGWAPEYVRAMWLMLQRNEPDDFIIATGRTHSLEEFVEFAFSRMGFNWREWVTLDPSLYRDNEASDCSANPAKAEIDLNWRAKMHLEDIVDAMLTSRLD